MYKKILIPTDGSDEAEKASKHAVQLASEIGANITALYVIRSRVTGIPSDVMKQVDDVDEWRAYGEEITQDVLDIAAEHDVSGKTAVTSGKAYQEIVDYADENDIDAIVMGTQGRDGIGDLLLGNVTERVVRSANVPVITVRQPKL